MSALRMDSPPPTQVPLRDPMLDTPRSLQPPSSPTATSTPINSGMGSPTHTPNNNNNNNINNSLHNSSSSSLRAEHAANAAAAAAAAAAAERDSSDALMGLNGHGSALAQAQAQAHSFAQVQAHAAAAYAAAQLHNQSALLAAHSRHHLPNPMSQLMRKSLMPKVSPGGYPRSSPPGGGGGGGGGGVGGMTAPGTVPDHTACNVIIYRDRSVAAFNVDGRELICLPQAFEFFLKHLVGGLHTVYTKLKRLDIQPLVCNVEQVRVLRGLGAIQPGVNRCKLISCAEFDILYDDCNNSK